MRPANILTYKGIQTIDFIASMPLLIGDAVFTLINDGRVAKGIAAVDHSRYVGIVVGGHLTYGEALQEDIDIGKPAANTDGEIIVANAGIVKAVTDGPILRGQRGALSTVIAGRIKGNPAAGEVYVCIPYNGATLAGTIIRVALVANQII